MIELKVLNPHWIKGSEDDPEDQCAHGAIEFSIDSVNYVNKDGGDWTISAASLYLLRTIESDHTNECSVTEGSFLFPDDGFSIFPDNESKYGIIIFGGPTGINPEVRHQDGKVLIQLNDITSTVNLKDWIIAVLDFIEQVESFYNNSSPKSIIEDGYERKGWTEFWREWNERKNKARKLLETL